MSAEDIIDGLVARNLATECSPAARSALDQRIAAVRHLADIMGIQLDRDVAMAALFGSMAHQAILIQEGLKVDVIDTDPGRIVAEVGLVQVALSHIIDSFPRRAQP